MRLFNLRSLQHLLRDAGFVNMRVRGVPAPFPKVLGTGLLGRSAVAINLALIRVSKTLFSYQFFVGAQSTPDVAFVVRDTKRSSLRPSPLQPCNWLEEVHSEAWERDAAG